MAAGAWFPVQPVIGSEESPLNHAETGFTSPVKNLFSACTVARLSVIKISRDVCTSLNNIGHALAFYALKMYVHDFH